MKFLLGFALSALVVFFLYKNKQHNTHPDTLENYSQSKKGERLTKILSWCKNKYNENERHFNNVNPDAISMLITMIANAGSALYLRTCGVRVTSEGIKFSSSSPMNLLNVITNDTLLLFLLGEEMKEFEPYPSGNHKEKAITYYKSVLEEQGREKSWEELKVDIYSFIQKILIETSNNRRGDRCQLQ